MQRRKWEFGFVLVFVLLNLVAPFAIGERFPFTISPMFCDQPSEYCTYEVLAPDGSPVDSKQFGLHLVYDGNPPGLGMGIVPQQTLHPFGQVGTEAQVRQRVQKVFAETPSLGLEFVVVRQEHVFVEDQKLKTQHKQWKISK